MNFEEYQYRSNYPLLQALMLGLRLTDGLIEGLTEMVPELPVLPFAHSQSLDPRTVIGVSRLTSGVAVVAGSLARAVAVAV